jgi:hypothetical protein
LRYLLLIHVNPDIDALRESEQHAFEEAHKRFRSDTQSENEFLSTHRLGDRAQTTIVRCVGGEPIASEGPYADRKSRRGPLPLGSRFQGARGRARQSAPRGNNRWMLDRDTPRRVLSGYRVTF